jgi:hypothetical protein
VVKLAVDALDWGQLGVVKVAALPSARSAEPTAFNRARWVRKNPEYFNES